MTNTASSDRRLSCDTAYWEQVYRDSQASLDYDGWLDDIELAPGMAVLDLGCGTGTDTLALLKRGVCVTAADFSQTAIDQLRSALAHHLVSADCFDMRFGLPYIDAGYDAVVADLSLHYFRWVDTVRIVAEIARVLLSGGRLVARVHSVRNLPLNAEASLDPIENRYYRIDGCNRRYFTMEDIRSLFADWQLLSLHETTIHRYGMRKQVLTFIAQKR